MTDLIEDFRNFATAPKNNDNHHNMRCNTQRNTHNVSNVRAVLTPAEKKTEKRMNEVLTAESDLHVRAD